MSAKIRGSINRRQSLKPLGTALAGLPLLKASGAEPVNDAMARSPQGADASIVVIGGGFGGATLARRLKTIAPKLRVTLVDKSTTYTACPFSNLVIAGQRKLVDQQFGWRMLKRAGIEVINSEAKTVDTNTRQVTLADGKTLSYDKLVMAPGISLKWDSIEGYNQQASKLMPHAWQAGGQTVLLRRQIETMPDNGVVAISIPENPYRCPPGPYERASLIAHYLSNHKPRAKLLLLDAKDSFSKKQLFETGWQSLYGDRIEWRGLSDSGKVNRVEPTKGVVHTDFDRVKADVANIIPPQAASLIAKSAGITDASGWCPVNPTTFESTRAANVYVIGDAAIANAMPKSAFAANAQAKVCAVQIVRELNGEPPVSTTLINTCYSLLAPDYGISVAGVYRPNAQSLVPVPNTGGTSPMRADLRTRALEPRYARSRSDTITSHACG